MKKLMMLFRAFISALFMAAVIAVVPAAPAMAADMGVVLFDLQYSGVITPANIADQYTVKLTAPGRLSLHITNGSFGYSYTNEISVYWYDSAGATMRSGVHSFGSRGTTAYSASMDLEAGEYFIRVQGINGHTGAYFLTVSSTPAYNNETEPNNAVPDQAQLIGSGEQIKGFISYQDDIDLYKVELPQSWRLSLNISNDTFASGINALSVCWYNGTGGLIRSDNHSFGYNGTTAYNASMYLEAGTYYFLIEKIGSNTGAYFLKAEFPSESLSQNWYTVLYNANWGSGVPEPQTKTHGAPLALSSVIPARTGYNFLGWAASSEATVEEHYSGGLYTADADITLYAVWFATAPSYTITYDANDGAGAPPPQTKIHGTALQLSIVLPTRDGYTFLGWAKTATASAALYAPGVYYSVEANRTLYAVWQKNAASPVLISGDVTGDGLINMQDVLLIYQYFRGKTALTKEQATEADANGDGVVNMTDVLLTYQYFRGKIASFGQ